MRYIVSVAAIVLWALASGACAPVSGAVPPDLANTRWRVEDLEGRGVVDRVQSTLEFGERGAASGNLACNRFTTSYEQTGPGLRFGLVAATRRMCPEAVMDQEQRFNAVLGNTRGALVKEPYLYLLDERGATLARLIRHEPAEAASPE
jgi:heat shock protein HslJ